MSLFSMFKDKAPSWLNARERNQFRLNRRRPFKVSEWKFIHRGEGADNIGIFENRVTGERDMFTIDTSHMSEAGQKFFGAEA